MSALTFAELFQGRTDAYGSNAGGCDRSPTATWDEYQERIASHLMGQRPFGVYPLRDDLTVGWGCSDFDEGDQSLPHALNLARGLRLLGANAWIEVSRSKGFHVWTFPSEPVPAQTMRDALLAVHQALEIPAKEVNPKQTKLDGLKGFGNYVRLPYPGSVPTGHTANGRQMVLWPDEPDDVMPLDHFCLAAWDERTPVGVYEQIAARYIPPPPPQQVDMGEPTAAAAALAERLGKPGYLAWRYGPQAGHDRSSSMVRLAHICREDGLSPADAFAVVEDLDRRLGKFVGRADRDDQILKMIQKAYG